MEKKNKANKRLIRTLTVLAFILIILATVLALAARWVMSTWANLSMSELMYQLSAPIEGTNEEMIMDCIFKCVIPAVVIIGLMGIVFYASRKKKTMYKVVLALSVTIASSVLFYTKSIVWDTLAVDEYLSYQNNPSTFIEENYVDPDSVNITFPEQKRNLIYIFLESMETTYSDISHGGGFDVNVIPELTTIAQSNEDFSGNETKLNGAYALPYTTWTMGAMFAQTSGLPMIWLPSPGSLRTQHVLEIFLRTMVTVIHCSLVLMRPLVAEDCTLQNMETTPFTIMVMPRTMDGFQMTIKYGGVMKTGSCSALLKMY